MAARLVRRADERPKAPQRRGRRGSRGPIGELGSSLVRRRSDSSIDRVKQLHRVIRPLGEPTRRTLEHGRREPIHPEDRVPLAHPT